MPTYEYACRSCGEHIEAVQSFMDDPLTTCSTCGGDLRKVFGSIGIAFKGSGFYKTDSRSADASSRRNGKSADADTAGGDKGESKADAKGESKGESKSDAKSDAKSDSKPDAKSEPKAAASP